MLQRTMIHSTAITRHISPSRSSSPGPVSYFELLTSTREPILEVVNEMCSSPMTISSSWRPTLSGCGHSASSS